MEHGIDDACRSLFLHLLQWDIWMDCATRRWGQLKQLMFALLDFRPGSKESIICNYIDLMILNTNISFIFVCIVIKNSSCNCDGLTWPNIFHSDGKISLYVKKT